MAVDDYLINVITGGIVFARASASLTASVTSDTPSFGSP
ncbi:hypothetical protein CSC18_4728 [Klebsiella aerogenes]|nr:hypothetical protein CSC18_4728 [Klebsiella aerogenes]